MSSIEDIIKQMRITRPEFARLFLRAQSNVGIAVKDRQEFEAIATTADKAAAFGEAMSYCKKKRGLFKEMLNVIIRSGLDEGALMPLIRDRDKKLAAELQAVTNYTQGYIEPAVFLNLFANGMKWTGKVLIDGTARGSGVLIGPKRFLTAFHVVEPLFDFTKNEKGELVYKPREDPSLEIEFDDYIYDNRGKLQAMTSKKIGVESNWLEAFSSCHEIELDDKVPDPHSDLKGFWDYAIIRLDRLVDEERQWADLDKRSLVPESRANIVLFQYPDGRKLKADIDEIASTEKPDIAIPEIRFLHTSNADHGSSGGPCFDKEVNLVGIHQGKWPDQINGKITNRGIPIRNIAEDLETKHASGPVAGISLGTDPGDYLIWYLDKTNYDPVIGIDNFQFIALTAEKSGNGNIIPVVGGGQSGRTYCILTLMGLLADSDNLKLILPGEAISKMGGLEVARYIAAAAGAGLGAVTSQEAYNSTAAAWLRDEVCTALVAVLDAQRGKRNVWLCITDLNKHDIRGKYTDDFLFMLYECVARLPWLQIVLDAPKRELPFSLYQSQRSYFTVPKTEEDIRQYLRRFLKGLNIVKEGKLVDALATMLYGKYLDRLAHAPSIALSELNKECKAALTGLMQRLGTTR